MTRTPLPPPLAELAHELRTPVGAIVGMADAMRQRAFGPLAERYAEHAELIHAAGLHLLALTERLAEAARDKEERGSRRFQHFDVAAMVEQMAPFFAWEAERAGLQFHLDLPAPALEIDADPVAIRQILINLIANAIKFAPRGAVIRASLARRRRRLVVRVTNPVDQDRARYESRRGTGLGRKLVDALSEVHGGISRQTVDRDHLFVAEVRLPVLTRP